MLLPGNFPGGGGGEGLGAAGNDFYIAESSRPAISIEVVINGQTGVS